MLFAVLLLAAFPNWIPARWNSGDPRSLDLLAGTPVNCVLLESPAWNAPFIHRAAERHIVTLGIVHSIQQARSAVQLKLNGVVLEGDYDPALADGVRSALAGTNAAVIELPVRRRIRLDSHDPILGTSQGLWPGIQIEHGGTVMAGPSSNPWIDTNTGFLRFVRAATGSAIWIGVRPRPKMAFPVERYAVAIADAAISGARWIVALDDDLDRRLLDGDPQAAVAWKRITQYIQYFEDKSEWRDYRPYSQFAVVQDADSGGLLSASLLDMLSVQHTAVRPIATRRLSAESLHGSGIVLNVDAASLSAQQKQALDEFTASGGVLVNPPNGWSFPRTASEQMVPDRKQMNQIQGLWEVTYNATARKNFGARTFNTSSILFNLLAAPDAKSLLIHLVNYTDFPAETVTVQVLGKWKRARLYQPGAPVRELSVYPAKDGTAIDIDKISVLATLRMDQ